jgi:hypothetical protein
VAFPEDIVRQAWERSGGQCECNRRTHKHFYTPCGKTLKYEKRGDIGEGAWEVRQLKTLDGDTLSNCEIICMECHEAYS